MSSRGKYKIDGQYLTITEAIEHVSERAQELDPVTREAYLTFYSKLFNYDMAADHRKSVFNTYVVPGVGLVLLVAILYLAYQNPFPSIWQSGISWIVVCLAAGACAATIPGFFEFKYKDAVRATGAIGVMAFMYIFPPTVMEMNMASNSAKMTLYVANRDTSNVNPLVVDFEPNSSKGICEFSQKAIKNYYGQTKDSFTFFRKSDGMIYSTEPCVKVSELNIIAVTNPLIRLFPNTREAYRHFQKLSDRE